MGEMENGKLVQRQKSKKKKETGDISFEPGAPPSAEVSAHFTPSSVRTISFKATVYTHH